MWVLLERAKMMELEEYKGFSLMMRMEVVEVDYFKVLLKLEKGI